MRLMMCINHSGNSGDYRHSKPPGSIDPICCATCHYRDRYSVIRLSSGKEDIASNYSVRR